MVPEPNGLFTVTMLDVLREPFEEWLASRGLMIARIPDPDIETPLIVVPVELNPAEEMRRTWSDRQFTRLAEGETP